MIAIIEPEESRLRALRDAWDEEREREKQAKAEAERQRVEGIRTRIEAILLDAVAVSGKSSAEIAEAASRIEAMDISINDFAEFTGQAQAKRDETVEFLRTKHAEAVAREEEAARLKAEREELDRLRAEAEAREREAAGHDDVSADQLVRLHGAGLYLSAPVQRLAADLMRGDSGHALEGELPHQRAARGGGLLWLQFTLARAGLIDVARLATGERHGVAEARCGDLAGAGHVPLFGALLDHGATPVDRPALALRR
ncbi:hypothetical protein N6G06_07575 [Cupriavidus gilardii]|uniref:hypothetical protein n=1 Tax=Cupriavidus gilardii TaxID=82541 RepID=UPI0021C12F1A|nr:hypothetical protein [Cupriavidus gilardii]MCT9071222.1 hypothetical protein [Cupriavidus gilardii]